MIEDTKRNREADKIMTDSRSQILAEMWKIMRVGPNDSIDPQLLMNEFDFERMRMGHVIDQLR